MIKIHIDDDFDLDRIAGSGQCFRWRKNGSGAYHIVHKEHYLQIRSLGSSDYALSCPEAEYKDIWYPYFDLGENYRCIRERVRKEDDPFLYDACEYGKGIRILRQDPWEMLISFIISQNKNIPSIQKCVELLCETAGRLKKNPEYSENSDNSESSENSERPDGPEGSYYIFPTPEEILSMSDEALANCRLGYRCKYVKAAAADVAEGRLDLNRLCSEEEETTIQELTKVFGVGRKVANCISLFGLHHVDAFPIDVWIKRILENEYPGGYPKDKYRPYNGIYQQYMFFYYREKFDHISRSE